MKLSIILLLLNVCSVSLAQQDNKKWIDNPYADSSFNEVIDDKGSVGKLGQVILNEMQTKTTLLKLKNPFGPLCSDYQSKSEVQKKKVWLFYWRSLLIGENKGISKTGPGTGNGGRAPFAMELNTGVARANRPRCFEEKGAPYKIYPYRSLMGDAACAVQIMATSVENRARGSLPGANYWGTVGSRNFDIRTEHFRTAFAAAKVCRTIEPKDEDTSVEPIDSNPDTFK